MEQSQSIALTPAEQHWAGNVDSNAKEAGDHHGFGPERRPLALEGKGFWHRASSYILDGVALNGFGALAGASAAIHVSLFEAFLDRPLGTTVISEDATLLLGLALYLVYFTVFEWVFGATPGKAISKLRVVKVDGSPCTFAAALGRSFSRLVDGLFFGGIAALNMHQPLNQRWGDKLAHTQVVDSNNPGIQQHHSWLRFGLAFIVVWVLQTIVVLAAALLLP